MVKKEEEEEGGGRGGEGGEGGSWRGKSTIRGWVFLVCKVRDGIRWDSASTTILVETVRLCRKEIHV